MIVYALNVLVKLVSIPIREANKFVLCNIMILSQ